MALVVILLIILLPCGIFAVKFKSEHGVFPISWLGMLCEIVFIILLTDVEEVGDLAVTIAAIFAVLGVILAISKTVNAGGGFIAILSTITVQILSPALILLILVLLVLYRNGGNSSKY